MEHFMGHSHGRNTTDLVVLNIREYGSYLFGIFQRPYIMPDGCRVSRCQDCPAVFVDNCALLAIHQLCLSRNSLCKLGDRLQETLWDFCLSLEKQLYFWVRAWVGCGLAHRLVDVVRKCVQA